MSYLIEKRGASLTGLEPEGLFGFASAGTQIQETDVTGFTITI